MLEHSHQVCQMLNIWHLAHQTPKTNPHQVFQISKICHTATVSSQIWNSTNINAKYILAYLISFSLSSYQISLSPSTTQLSLSSLVSVSLAPYFFLTFIFFFLSLSSSLVLTLLDYTLSCCHAAELCVQATAVLPISPGAAARWSCLELPISPLSTPYQSLSLSLGGYGSVSNGGWLILVEGGGLIGLWVWDLGWSQIGLWWLMLGFFFFFFLVAVADIGGRWFILWGWSVVMGCGGWSVSVGGRGLCIYIYIYIYL